MTNEQMKHSTPIADAVRAFAETLADHNAEVFAIDLPSETWMRLVEEVGQRCCRIVVSRGAASAAGLSTMHMTMMAAGRPLVVHRAAPEVNE
jgi:hypothetical protein